MQLIKIDRTNIDLAHKIQSDIFSHYDAYNNFLDTFKPTSKNEFWLIKDDDNNYIGTFGIYSYKAYPKDAWLGWFGFLEEYRGKGYGKVVLKMFEDIAKDRGFKFARLFTDRFDNDRAKHFYEMNGYSEEYYELESDPASLIYPLSIYSKSLYDDIPLIKWNNRDIHFTKQVRKQQ